MIVASLMKDFFGLHHLPKGVDFFENMYLVGLRLNEVSFLRGRRFIFLSCGVGIYVRSPQQSSGVY